MFIGSIDDLEKGSGIYHKELLAALEYLKTHNFAAMKDGRYAVRDGIYFNLSRYKTKDMKDCPPESHRKYIDIQFIVEGEECLGWCPLSPDLTAIAPYDKDNDITFYKVLVPESSIILLAGNFAILYPEDVHRPCVAVEEPGEPVTKVVVKVPVELVGKEE